MAKRFKQYKNYNTERINEDIRAAKVRMIKPDGDHEILSAADAIKKANGMGLDLVEVAPQADPPVCRVLDYKKYVYEKKKKEKEAKKKQHTVDIKELRFRPHTDDHDYDFKMKHAQEFLKDGNKVKATVQFRGRDIIYSDKGRELLDRFAQDLSDLGKMESKPSLEGKRMSVIIAPEK
ncbi:MAG: translation initiation factor IF-3 [Cyclonatronaceae bacterium]